MGKARSIPPLDEPKKALVASCYPLACRIAFLSAGPFSHLVDDYLDAATDGLIRAAHAFEPVRNLPFRKLAAPYIRNEISDRRRRMARKQVMGWGKKKYLRRQVPLGVGALDVCLDPRLPDDEPDFDGLIGHLPERERMAVEMRYRDGLEWPQVAERIGVHMKTASTIAARAIERLREQMAPA